MPQLVIQLTSEQTLAVEQADSPIRATDAQNREYVILSSELFDRMKRVLEIEEIDRSFYECEDEIPLP